MSEPIQDDYGTGGFLKIFIYGDFLRFKYLHFCRWRKITAWKIWDFQLLEESPILYDVIVKV